MSTRVVLIRHAATDPGARLCGALDVSLTPAGRAQVQALLRRRPSRAAPDAVYTSPLTRARDVAAALARAWCIEPRAAVWAREIDCGDVEGLPLDRLQRDFPDLWARNEAQDDDRFAWPGGENYGQFRSRILAGLRTVADQHTGGRVAVVTHAGVISQVVGVVRCRPAAVWQLDRPDPFTATEIAWRNGAPAAVVSFNDPDWY